MRNSLDGPGVGEYNAYRVEHDHRGNKWSPDPEKAKKLKKSDTKLPPVGTYNPNPASYSLFSSVSGTSKNKNGGFGGKT